MFKYIKKFKDYLRKLSVKIRLWYYLHTKKGRSKLAASMTSVLRQRMHEESFRRRIMPPDIFPKN